MVPEVVIASLACSQARARSSRRSSRATAPAVAARLNDCEAKLLITADGFYRRGKLIPMKEIADEAVAQAPSVEHVLVSTRAIGRDVPWDEGRDRLVARRASRASRARSRPSARTPKTRTC